MYKYTLIILFIIISLLTLFPRSVELINHNYLFGFDQGREYLAAKSIVVDHKFTLIGTEIGAGSAGISGIFHGPTYYYILAIPFIILNGDPYGGMVFMWAMSILAVFLTFILGRRLFNAWAGFLAAILAAISPPLISQARFIWSPNPLSPFILLAFYFLYRFLKTNKLRDIFLSSFFSAFIYNFELAIAIPMCMTLFVFVLAQTRLKNIKAYIFMILGFVIAFSPAIIFEVRHNFLALGGLFGYLNTGEKASSDSAGLLSYVPSHFSSFVFNAADTFPARGIISGDVLLLLLLLGVIYFIRFEKNKEIKAFMIYLLLLPLFSFFVFSFLRNSVYHYYLTHLNFAYILMLVYITRASLKSRKILLFLLILIYTGILIIHGSINSIFTTKKDLSDYGGIAKINGVIDAVDYIYQDAEKKDFGLLVFAPPVYTYQYDYVLWWRGLRKYGYIPHKEKTGEFYLWIEPDPSKPWSYKGWLETVIKTGKVEKTEELPSGFIIQKRTSKSSN